MGAKTLQANERTATTPTLSVFGYTDFRKYLGDFYQLRKTSVRGYSYRNFSKAAGFASPNFLKLLIDGERNLGAQAVEKCIKALQLPATMAEYFRALVRLNQSTSDTEKSALFDELVRLTPQAKRRDLQSEELRYLSHWIYPVLREMIQVSDFSDDPHWIVRRLYGRVSVEEVTGAMRFLVGQGFIKKQNDGSYVANDNIVLSGDEVRSLAVRNFHRQMLVQAEAALENLPLSEREFGALTLILPTAAMTELKEKLKAFRRELHLWSVQASDANAGDQVVQINIQMYPHTKRVQS